MADTSVNARIKRIMDATDGEEGSGQPYIMKRDNITPEDEEACSNDENCQDIETPKDAADQQIALQKKFEYNDLKKNDQPLPSEDEIKNDSDIPEGVKPFLLSHIQGLNSGEIDPHEEEEEDEAAPTNKDEEINQPKQFQGGIGMSLDQESEDDQEPHATIIGGRLFGQNSNKLPMYMRNRQGKIVKPL